MKKKTIISLVALLLVLTPTFAFAASLYSTSSATETPIQHVVVIFQENVSFDHYFATYPTALNLPGEPNFVAGPHTPSVNGLSGSLLTNNPNQVQPFRLDRSQEITCDNDHDYTAEQQAYNRGAVNNFVQATGCSSVVMGYYDGNTVTGLWEYAQYYAMSDNFFGTTFGPSTPGALNLVSGQTSGASPYNLAGIVVNGTVIGDADPTYDDCSSGTTIAMSGTNIGNLLNEHNVTWGWFEGGFKPTSYKGETAVCGSWHTNYGGANVTDYSAHHEPFQYYASTANPHHLPPTSVAMIGHTDQANHQYDISDFWAALKAGNLPAVTFLKAPKYEDEHAGYSDPLDGQNFTVNAINAIEKSPYWPNTAIFITYDDSDGWYDHVMPPITSQSSDPSSDVIFGNELCGTVPSGYPNDRCGFGPRLPLLVISPWARHNYVDNTITDQTSILKFIEDNWSLGRIGGTSFDNTAGTLDNMFNFNKTPGDGVLILDPSTGLPIQKPGNESTISSLPYFR
jgi:phospholipase C